MNRLKISGLLEQSLTNGEGLRAVIFFQGCTHNCDGCHNKYLQPKDNPKKNYLNYKRVLKTIVENATYIDGVTLSGGEPFQQNMESLYNLIKYIKDNTNLNIWIYTGYKLDHLLRDRKSKLEQSDYITLRETLNLVDTIVDGRYDKNLPDTGEKTYRGSTNQRLLKREDIKRIIEEVK